MQTGIRIAFLVDEHLPARLLLPILEARGHQATPVEMATADAAILTRAEKTASVIITADSWFLDELFRYPVGHRRCYSAAGVIQVPGEWAAARLRLTTICRLSSRSPRCEAPSPTAASPSTGRGG